MMLQEEGGGQTGQPAADYQHRSLLYRLAPHASLLPR